MADLPRSEGVETNISGLNEVGTDERRAGVTDLLELKVDDGPGDNVLHGKTTVTTAGTAVSVMGAATATRSITIRANRTNSLSSIIYVGGSTVSSTDGFELGRGQSVTLDVDNSQDEIYIDTNVNGSGVSWIAVDK